MTPPPREPRPPTLWEALLPVAFLVPAIALTIIVYQGPVHIPLILSTAVAGVVALRLGLGWTAIEEGMVHGIGLGLRACLVLMVVGTLIGEWILAGIVPAMIYYGLQLLAPSFFLLAACVICAVVSLSTGSSWSTAATIGLALMAIGNTLGVPAPMTAGAIVSGSYFGDKMSPVSDTTNLAPAAAGTDLFTHIRHMIYTTGPSLLIALVLYGLLGLGYRGDVHAGAVVEMRETLARLFVLSPWLLVPMALVIGIIILRVPALPALLVSSLIGALLAMLVQGADGATVLQAAFRGYAGASGVEAVDKLLNRGGLANMLETIALVICALSFGGVMERSGMLGALAHAALRVATSTGRLVAVTILTCIGFNVVASDQYIAIVIPGRMYREAFLARGLHPKNLSRCLEDSGTLSSPLIPWNSCGAFMTVTLGVSALAYLPFAFLNLINPLISILYGFTGVTMHRLPDDQRPPSAQT